MSYSLTTLWFERQRYLPGVLAVGFIANLLVRPVPERYHEPARPLEKEAAA